MENVIRGHLGSGAVRSVRVVPSVSHMDETVDVEIEIADTIDEATRNRLFSLARVVREHLLEVGDERFPMLSLKKRD